MDISFQEIKVFDVLWREKNLTSAALKLNLSQPALSKSLKNLESKLNRVLFIRNKTGLVPTPEGSHFFSSILPKFRELSESLKEIQEEKVLLKKEKFKIGILPELGELLGAQIIKWNDLESSPFHIEIKLESNTNLEAMLKKGQIEVMISFRKFDQEEIKSYHYKEQNIFLVTHPSVYVELKNIRRLRFALYREQDPLLELFHKKFFSSYSRSKVEVDFLANSHSLIIDYITSHPGILGILPELSAPVKLGLATGKIKSINEFSTVSNLYISFLSSIKKSKKQFILKYKNE